MAKKLTPIEFLERHWRETEAVERFFRDKKELRYAELRRRLFFNTNSQLQPNATPELRHETQLTRILKAMCEADRLNRITKDRQVYYRIHEGSGFDETLNRRIAIDSSYFNEVLHDKAILEERLTRSEDRIYQLNIEIGRLTSENLELKDKLREG